MFPLFSEWRSYTTIIPRIKKLTIIFIPSKKRLYDGQAKGKGKHSVNVGGGANLRNTMDTTTSMSDVLKVQLLMKK